MTSGLPHLALALDTVRVHNAESGGEPQLLVGGSIAAHVPAAVLPASAVPASVVPGSVVPASVELVGSRLVLHADVEIDGDRWSAYIPLLTSRWGGPRVAPPSGEYRLRIMGTDAAVLTSATSTTPPQEPTLVAGVCLIEFSSAASNPVGATDATSGGPSDALTVTFSAPLTASERGPAQQARLEAQYHASKPTPLNAVFFESFYGQNASCNPRALDREIARTHPSVTRYWSVVDASVEVPAGGIALIEGSEEWWRVRAGARLLVVNDWLRKRFRRRAHQTVLQTWHGTPLKRIALTRRGLRPRAALATLRERARWDILLSQNTYSTHFFRTAYAFAHPWEEGYPRNDVLAGDAGAERGLELRDRLGVPRDATVVLYAPTWRDDHPEEVDQLDVAAFARELGPGYFTLIRGHSRTLRAAQDVHAANVLDVTSYPDVADLFLVADALVTDYSSAMFDFTVTGKPIYFFTPDLDRYRDEVRGFYFDLLAVSPGPVSESAEDLVANLRSPDAARERFAHRYAAWVARFNSLDDGHASERVVRRLEAHGAIG
ncbi:CDP-glycerol glycerophosphotransferase (TagB/SpsB family) [Glaciihabitans tibetensis]|uniref:CDP-glycerol glycerophosphotransferase (TagB/SpsB family) n=1 Tax=Glaciihabitans tibetensis TaxID=1266600 RepID=A0A2T0VH12_9MICO|nr:CDP-glycerol glycerophosphotransferase family protein [Glaciihabitans tibetensis]PRY69465.1 CDP-glycerol glycerophosphotransferase (TagB/SpsB family) [Glaciihabitans tibetensis]